MSISVVQALINNLLKNLPDQQISTQQSEQLINQRYLDIMNDILSQLQYSSPEQQKQQLQQLLMKNNDQYKMEDIVKIGVLLTGYLKNLYKNNPEFAMQMFQKIKESNGGTIMNQFNNLKSIYNDIKTFVENSKNQGVDLIKKFQNNFQIKTQEPQQSQQSSIQQQQGGSIQQSNQTGIQIVTDLANQIIQRKLNEASKKLQKNKVSVDSLEHKAVDGLIKSSNGGAFGDYFTQLFKEQLQKSNLELKISDLLSALFAKQGGSFSQDKDKGLVQKQKEILGDILQHVSDKFNQSDKVKQALQNTIYDQE